VTNLINFISKNGGKIPNVFGKITNFSHFLKIRRKKITASGD
jgi:hypothetical protein